MTTLRDNFVGSSDYGGSPNWTVLLNCLLTASDIAMKLRSFLSILAVVVLVLLLSSAGGFYWLIGRNPLSLLPGEQGKVPGAAIFISKQAPVVASLLLNPDQLETFRLVSTSPGERRQARAELDQLKQSLLASTGLDYQRDIQPWLGQEITLAVTTLDIDRDAANGQQPGYLAAIATQDPERSREFLQLFWQKRAIAGADLVFEQYKGVKIIVANAPAPTPESQRPERPPKAPKYRVQRQPAESAVAPPPIPTLASAAVGDRFVLFANHPKVLRDAINNVQAPNLSLDQSQTFTHAIETLTERHIGLTVVDLPKLASLLGHELPAARADAAAQTLVVGFELNRNGLLAETALLAPDGTSTAIPSLSQPVQALQYVPRNGALSASGTHLDRLVQQLSASLAPYETVTQFVNQPLQDLQARWQLDLAEDVFRWVKGDYALVLLPPDTVSADGTIQPDWVFAAQRPQSDDDRQAITHLDDLARQQGLNVGPLQLGDRTVSAWTRLTAAKLAPQSLNLQADVQGVHTTIGNYEIFATSVTAMDQALKAADRPLPGGDRFQQAIAALAKPNNGYLFLDWDASQPILERQYPLLKVVELAGKPFFGHLRSLTLSSYGTQAGVQRGGIFIQLGRVGGKT